MKRIVVALVALGCIAADLPAQHPDTLDLTAVGRDVQWRVASRATAVVEIKGKRALELSRARGVGIVWLDGYEFSNGTIDVDLLGRSQPSGGSFLGVAFRVADAGNYDAVYFRPFNFRAADSAQHSHAVQYVSEPRWPWHVLRSQHPGRYEAAVVPEAEGDDWFHARIVVSRPTIRVFVNGATKPTLTVDELSNRSGGAVGIWVGESSGGHFANLVLTRAP